MIELKRVIAPVDDTPFDEICSFETENYIGIYVDCMYVNDEFISSYVILPKNDLEFSIDFVNVPVNLEQLDNKVFEIVGEHITCVSTSRQLDIKICED